MQACRFRRLLFFFSNIVLLFFFIHTILFTPLNAQPLSGSSPLYDSFASKIIATALQQNMAITMLTELCTTIGPRLAGSPQAAKAVEWAATTMEELGLQNVHTEPVMVPHWIRGIKEEGSYFLGNSKTKHPLHITALGGSIGTQNKGITAEIVEIRSWDELNSLGGKVKGKIVFFNRPMDRSLVIPAQAYGKAVDQRSEGAIEASRWGAVAALVRSMTTRNDNIPHTGAMGYVDSIPKIPAAAVSTNDADLLSGLLAKGKNVSVTLILSCESLPPVESANVLGELVGSEKPNEIIVIGAHLDSWDKGQGAHDNGAGCIQALEALRLLKELGMRPSRTIRAVLFMNEEHGLNGGTAYAERECLGEKHIAALESDGGGFSPRRLSVSDSAAQITLSQYASLFRSIGADHMTRGSGGSDIGPLVKKGVVGIGLHVDGQRYFDYHHSDNDTIDKVNERELALGAAVEAIIAYIIAQEGL
jgi:carboxypeptidase Q